MAKKIAPFGSWSSPLTAEAVASSNLFLGEVKTLGGDVYWTEGRPAENGRVVVVRKSPSSSPVDMIPKGFNARTRVHEYGGGAYFVHGSTLFFSNYVDQRLYRRDKGEDPRPVTPEPEIPSGLRYADGVVTPDGELTICVRERHFEVREAINEIVAFSSDGSGEAKVLATGRDFYAFPRISRDSTRICWTCWDHPNLPWDGTELWVAHLAPDGSVKDERKVAGGATESILQPAWGPEDDLYFLSDRTGWWNLYRETESGVRPLAPMDADLGGPQWLFGLSFYDFLEKGEIAAICTTEGVDHLGIIGESPSNAGKPGAWSLRVAREPDLPFVSISNLRAHDGKLAFIAGSPTDVGAVVSLDQDGEVDVLKKSTDLSVDSGFISRAEEIEFPTEHGVTAYGFFYPPTNEDFEGPPGSKPPLLVFSHGGPTSRVTSALSLSIQFWTSRGFAVVDVNYGGSTGYGREYRQRLNGNWGVVDVADCINAAKYLVARGDVDGDRLLIRGGSAGGYTTLCALTFHDLFRAGANYFGVSDLEAFDQDTHKFESRYDASLIGPLPESKELYRERSPVNFPERISAPLITFQGLEDEIVPPSQSELVIKALQKKGIPYAYITYEGEQHGFRKAENVKHSLESELYFYGRILGFEPAGEIPPVEIHNLD